MIDTIGFVPLGHSSVSDGAEAIVSQLSRAVNVVQCGALDGLDAEDIQALAPCAGEKLLVCDVEPGAEAQVSYERMVPRVQSCIEDLEVKGAELITVLCGADWASLTSESLLINPGAILPQMVVSLSRGRKLGVILPTVHQVESSEQNYRGLGANAVATHATLYDTDDPLAEMQHAARFLAENQVDLVWMPCMGMNAHMQAAVRAVVERPVMLARSMLARVIDELIG